MSNIAGNQISGKIEWTFIAIVAVILFLVLKAGGTITGIFKGIQDTAGEMGETLNIRDTDAEKADKARLQSLIAAMRNDGLKSAFSSGYLDALKATTPAGKKIALIKRADADKLAATIWDSVGWYTDSATQGEGAIKSLKYKSQVSWLADVFFQNYKKDLLGWLSEKYDTTAQKQALLRIIEYVNALPTGVLNK